MTVLRHLLAIALLPFTVAVLVPAMLLRGAHPAPSLPREGAGSVLVTLGLALVATTVARFATRGRGTLAPWDPPRRLVVTGIYRHVRNPMITGVFFVLCGQALFFASAAVALWAAAFLAANAIYIPLGEERALSRRFGAAYEAYRRKVPRWIPRLTPWIQGDLPDDDPPTRG